MHSMEAVSEERIKDFMEPKLTGIEEPQVDRLLWFSIVWLE